MGPRARICASNSRLPLGRGADRSHAVPVDFRRRLARVPLPKRAKGLGLMVSRLPQDAERPPPSKPDEHDPMARPRYDAGGLSCLLFRCLPWRSVVRRRRVSLGRACAALRSTCFSETARSAQVGEEATKRDPPDVHVRWLRLVFGDARFDLDWLNVFTSTGPRTPAMDSRGGEVSLHRVSRTWAKECRPRYAGMVATRPRTL